MSSLKNYEPGDIKLISIKLTNNNKAATIDIRSQLLTFSIYEDIQEPTVYAEIVLNDALNLVKDFPIIGEEDVEISFITPGRDKVTTYKLRTFSIEGTSVSDNNLTSNYILKCVSHEHFTNSVQQVDKGYNSTVAEMIIDILKNELNIKKGINVEATRGLINVAVPRMNPFSAVDFLRQRAVAKRPSGGVFVFFENQFGYNFISLEKLIEDGKKTIVTKTFTHSPDTKSDKQRQAYAWKNITKFEHLTKFDTISKMSNGMFKNNVIAFDMTTKDVTNTQFKIQEQAKVFETGEVKARLTNTEKIINEADRGAPFYMFAPKDISKGNAFITDLMGYKLAFMNMFNQNVVRCQIYGDNYLAVGDMVALNLPESSGTTEKKVGDARFSGNYMVTKLRHMVYQRDRKFKYEITMDCNKVGYNA
jgi:hypothetical protein